MVASTNVSVNRVPKQVAKIEKRLEEVEKKVEPKPA